MKLIIGLGNPGEKYKNNRHNVGHMVADYLNSIGLPEKIVAKKTETFMNDSGTAVSKLKNFYKVSLSDLYIIHDDLDLPLGAYKIQVGVGPKVHNGLISIEETLGEVGFWRVRIGVDNRDPQNRVPGEAYVLQDFAPEEREIITDIIKKISTDLVTQLSGS